MNTRVSFFNVVVGTLLGTAALFFALSLIF